MIDQELRKKISLLDKQVASYASSKIKPKADLHTVLIETIEELGNFQIDYAKLLADTVKS